MSGGGGGALTFLFTDIEGSTQRWEHAPDAMKAALARHDELLRAAIGEHGGRVFATGGDGVAAVFGNAVDAADAALLAQAALAGEPWPEDAVIRVRMGLHTGHAEERDGDFFGPTLNRTARLMSVAHGGQVVCSGLTAGFLEDLAVPLVDLGAHRLRDLLAPVSVVQVGEGSFPPLRSLDSVPSNLPTFATELVGRSDDITALVEEVRANRVVTLTGVGGVGKTRLALAVAAAVAPEFPDGCWLVELAPVSDSSEVDRTVASALASTATAMADRQSLVRYLEMRRPLLVLDNCEHLLDECAALVDDVVAGTADVRIITTSREPLGSDGETVRRVRSLAVPETDDAVADDAAATPAVRLFVERAAAASDDFRLTSGNVADVVAICRHLDGIPLAIELAAARVRAMAPAEIAARLGDRFRVLTGGRRAQERHRTLLATVAWSYDLLADDERAVFAQLSVFPSTFDLEAAAAVVDVPGLDDLDVVDVVVRLVDRSLVVHDASTGRYRLLETLRQFAADRLADLGGGEPVRDRYVRHYLELVHEYGPGTEDGRHDLAVTTVLSELDNVRSTVELLVHAGRWDDVVRACLDAQMFVTQFVPGEAAVWLHEALERGAIDPVNRVEALGVAALVASSAVEQERSLRLADEALRVAGEHGLPEPVWAHFARAMVATQTGDNDQQLEAAEAMLAVATERRYEFAAITALSQTVVPLRQLGRLDEAERNMADSLRRAIELGNTTALSVALVTVCASLLDGPDPSGRAAALQLFDRHCERVLGLSGGINVAWVLLMRALASAARDPAEAIRYAVEAARMADRIDAAYPLGAAVQALADACALAGLGGEARRLVAYADSTAPISLETVGYPWVAEERDAALGALGQPPVDPATIPQNRRELFALLAEIERAVQPGG